LLQKWHEKQDARRLTHKELTDLRQRAIHAVQTGESPEVVARVMAVSRQALYGWLARYRQGGWDALDARKRVGGRGSLALRIALALQHDHQ